MRVAQEKVAAFHDKHGFANPEKPEMLTVDAGRVRLKLILEEANEYFDAIAECDLVRVADAIADMAYVVLGTAVAHGIDLQPLFDEVHRSNMTKDAAPANEPNRPFKGPDFQQPRLAELLMIQATGLAEAV